MSHETEPAEPHVANWWHVGPEWAESPALGMLSITFVIFVAILVAVLRPRISLMLQGRAHDVKKAIEEATRAKEAAQLREREANAKLAALGDEMKKLRADFESQGKAELERLEKMAQDAAVRIAKDAEDTITAESERARTSLRAEAAKLALELAEERIKGALTSADDARLQKALVERLDRPA